MSDALLTRVTLVPMDGDGGDPLGAVREGSIRVRDGRITGLGDLTPEPGETTFDGGGLVALPGFVQGHVHYCQTLFRGLAEDLPLMEWLRRRIWPLEAAHDPRSTRSSARLAVAELLLGGTTTAQVMESVHHGEAAIAVARESGMVTLIGNCLMDLGGPGVPERLVTTTAEARRLSEELHREVAAGPDAVRTPVQYVVSPRFILSCTDELLAFAAGFARDHRLRIHTHADEHPDEVREVRARTGTDNILALRDRGLLDGRTGLAHCVHTSEAERAALLETGTAVLHCPSTNLKLGSGLAPIAGYRKLRIPVALGADGAACNNRLSMLTEMRQAALLQALAAGPGAFTAAQALYAATAGGAAALGLQDEVGTLAVGRRADLVLLDLEHPPLAPGGDLATRLVFAAESGAVRHVMVGGTFAVRDGELCAMDAREIAAEARVQREALLSRAGLAR